MMKKVAFLCSANFRVVVLTGISEVEVILNVAGDVVLLFVLYPMCVRLLIIPDENSKQHNHSNLPDKADSWQTDPNVRVLTPAEEIAHALATVPHVVDCLLMLLWSLLSQRLLLQCHVQEPLCKRDYIYINLWPFGRVCLDAPLRNRGWTPLHCTPVNHSLLALLCLLLKSGWYASGVTAEIKSWLCGRKLARKEKQHKFS